MYGLIKNQFIFKKLETRIFGDNINTDQLHSPSKFGINKDALRSDYINDKTKIKTETEAAIKNVIGSIIESITGLNPEMKKKSKSILKIGTDEDGNEYRNGSGNVNENGNEAEGEGERNLLIIAGYNFGIGSSRFSTPLALKNEGVKCVAALSISRIFERNLAAAGIFALTISELKHGAKGSGAIKPFSAESVNNSGIKTADLFDLLKTGSETNGEIDYKSLSAGVKIKAGKDDSKMASAEITIKAGAEIITLTAGMDMFLYGVAASGGMVNYVAND